MAKAKTEETTGVMLLAFGKHSYIKMAFNMAVSLKYHNPDLPITLVHDENITALMPWMLDFFTDFKEVKQEHLYDNFGTKEQSMNPGKAKTFIYEYLSYDHNLYLDLDGAVLRPLDGLISKCINSGAPYQTQVVGWYTRERGDDFPEMQWAWPNDIWEHYKLSKTAKMPAINSSFAYIRKCPEAAALYAQIQSNMANPIPLNKLRLQWGRNQPDELYTNIALAQTAIDCELDYHPIYFNIRLERDWASVIARYDVLGLFGGQNFTHKSVADYYDRLLRKYCQTMGFEHRFKWHMLVKDKHANKRPQLT